MVEKLATGCCTTLLRRVYSTSSAKRSIRNVAIDTRSKLIIFYFLRWWIVVARKKIKFLRHVVNKLATSCCTTLLRRVYSTFSSKPSVRGYRDRPEIRSIVLSFRPFRESRSNFCDARVENTGANLRVSENLWLEFDDSFAWEWDGEACDCRDRSYRSLHLRSASFYRLLVCCIPGYFTDGESLIDASYRRRVCYDTQVQWKKEFSETVS